MSKFGKNDHSLLHWKPTQIRQCITPFTSRKYHHMYYVHMDSLSLSWLLGAVSKIFLKRIRSALIICPLNFIPIGAVVKGTVERWQFIVEAKVLVLQGRYYDLFLYLRVLSNYVSYLISLVLSFLYNNADQMDDIHIFLISVIHMLFSYSYWVIHMWSSRFYSSNVTFLVTLNEYYFKSTQFLELTF